MEFKIISKEEIEDIYPNNGTAKLDEMNEASQSKYLNIYSLYRTLLTEFMAKRANLKAYDEKITQSGLNFIPIKEEDMDVYQYYSKDYLKYFYVRSNTYIEKLNEEEINFLQHKIDNNDYSLDADTEKVMENTFKKVIFEDATKEGKKCVTFYGPNSSSFMAGNDSLVIGMRYDEFKNEGIEDNEWSNRHLKQLQYAYQLFDKMSIDMSQDLSMPISILKYNEFSVKKIKN